MRSEDQRIIEEITNKAVKNALAEMEQAKPKPITTTLGYMNVTSAEIDKSSGMEFYINVSEVSDAWISRGLFILTNLITKKPTDMVLIGVMQE